MKSDKKYIQRDPDCAWRMIDGSVLIVKMKEAGGSRVFTLNKTGTAIWEFVDGKHTESEIAAHVRDRFEFQEEADIDADVREFTDKLISRGLFIEDPQPIMKEGPA